jgi:DNA-binding MurR/RpiR family transcriptional regulator
MSSIVIIGAGECGGRAPPQNMHELRILVASGELEFSEGFRRILETGFKYPDAIAFGNTVSIASKCNISASTVTRMIKLLGFASFRDFRKIYRNHLKAKALDVPPHIANQASRF